MYNKWQILINKLRLYFHSFNRIYSRNNNICMYMIFKYQVIVGFSYFLGYISRVMYQIIKHHLIGVELCYYTHICHFFFSQLYFTYAYTHEYYYYVMYNVQCKYIKCTPCFFLCRVQEYLISGDEWNWHLTHQEYIFFVELIVQ